MPQSKKTKVTKKKRPRSSRASWSEGERRLDREAARAGIKPVREIEDLARLTPEDGEELLTAIQEMRALDRKARHEKEKRTRASKRAQTMGGGGSPSAWRDLATRMRSR